MTATKQCSRCGIPKPLDAFHRDTRQPDGYRAECKECRNARVRVQQREYQRQPGAKERRREYMREYMRGYMRRVRAAAKRED